MTAPPPLGEWLASRLPARIGLRSETSADWEFIVQLYASTRAEELAPVPWPEETKQSFLRAQCELQREHYRKHYQGADFWVIERETRAIGRLYLHAAQSELRIMDIALLPEERGRGLGTRMVNAILAYARGLDAAVTLHVEPLNPAQRLYERLGFTLAEDRGVYHFLQWRADQLNTIS